jgi:hypothetical protein
MNLSRGVSSPVVAVALLVLLSTAGAAQGKATPPAPDPPSSSQPEPSLRGPLEMMQSARENDAAVDDYMDEFAISREDAERRDSIAGRSESTTQR